MENFLIGIVKSTNGWVIFGVAIVYFGYESFNKYSSDKALDKTIEVIRQTTVIQIDRIEKSINKLTDQLLSLIRVIEK